MYQYGIRLISLRTPRPLRVGTLKCGHVRVHARMCNEQVQPYTAAGYTYVEGSGDKDSKSACLNTADIIAIQQGWP